MIPGWYQSTLRVLKRHGFAMVSVPSKLEHRLGVCARLHCGGLRATIRNGHVIVYVDIGPKLVLLICQSVMNFDRVDYALTQHSAMIRKHLTVATEPSIVRSALSTNPSIQETT